MWGGGGSVGGGAGHTLLGIGRGRPEQGGLLVRGGRGRQGQSLLATNLLLLLEETAALGVRDDLDLDGQGDGGVGVSGGGVVVGQVPIGGGHHLHRALGHGPATLVGQLLRQQGVACLPGVGLVQPRILLRV